MKACENLGGLFSAASMMLLVVMGATMSATFVSLTSTEKEEGHRHDEVARAATRVAIAAAVEDVDPFLDGWVADIDFKGPGFHLDLGEAQSAILRLPRVCICTAVIEVAPKQSPPLAVVPG